MILPAAKPLILPTHPDGLLPANPGGVLPRTLPTSRQTPSRQELPDGQRLSRVVSKRTARRIGEISNAASQIGALPKKNESIHLIMNGTYHGWSAVGAILNLAKPSAIADLVVATLGFNIANAQELFQLCDAGQVRAVSFVASCYFEKANPAEFQILRSGLSQRGHRCAAYRTHAKVIGARMTDGRCFVIETSANLRSCNNIEQLTLCQSPELFAFHKDWIDRLIATCGA